LRQLLAGAQIFGGLHQTYRRNLKGENRGGTLSEMATISTGSNEAATGETGMTDKEFVMDLLRRLPDDVTLYDIAQKVEFVAAVRQGLADLDAGRSVSIQQIERDLASWSVTVGHKRKRLERAQSAKGSTVKNRGSLQKRKAGDPLKSPAPSETR
jgi:predicted transcriptional regulator